MLTSLLTQEQRRELKQLAGLSTGGLELGLCVALGFWGGAWLDGKLGTHPWLQWVGLAFGLVAGFQSLYRLMRRAHRELVPRDL